MRSFAKNKQNIYEDISFFDGWMIVLPAFCAPSFCLAQNRSLLASDKLINFSKTLIPLNEGDKQGVTCDGIVWLKDAHFSSGTSKWICGERTLSRRVSWDRFSWSGHRHVTILSIFVRSTSARRILYEGSTRCILQCARLSWTDCGLTERSVRKSDTAPPDPEQWFHARIEVHGKEVSVYVNGARTPPSPCKN